MAYLVVRIKGTVDIPYWAADTLKFLHLEKKYRATIIPEDPSFVGMLKRIKNYVAWCRADNTIIKELIEKRGRKEGLKRVENADIESMGFKNIDELASAIADGKTTLSKIERIKPWFALAPPKGGFKKPTRRMYREKGIVGENPELPSLVKRML